MVTTASQLNPDEQPPWQLHLGPGEAKKAFLSEKIKDHNLVTILVVGKSEPYVFRGKVEQIYLRREGSLSPQLDAEIEFVGGPVSWGNASLEVGDRALLFVRELAGRLHEYPWKGHIQLVQIDGEDQATFPIPNMWMCREVPPVLRDAARQDPTEMNRSLVPLKTLELYLKELMQNSAHA